MKSRVERMEGLIRKFDRDMAALSPSQNIADLRFGPNDHLLRHQLREKHLIQILDLQKALCSALGKVGQKHRFDFVKCGMIIATI